jgi:hypothetical protein
MRLNVISPSKIDGPAPADNNPIAKSEGWLFLNKLALDTHKPSFALEAIVLQNTMPNAMVTVLQNTHCAAMKSKLENAPCCGSCINCPSIPADLFEQPIKMAKLDWQTSIPLLGADGKPLRENYTVLKDQNLNLSWFTDDSNATTFPCDGKKGGEVGEHYYNGIDFLEDFNLMLLACGTGDNLPKLVKPAVLKQIGGCEEAGKVHIVGPSEVCPGGSHEFNISTGAVHTPIDGEPQWKLGNTILKNREIKKLNLNKDKEEDYFNKTTMTFPNQPGAQQTMTYQYKGVNGLVTLTKTVTIIDKPNPPLISGVDQYDSKCIFNVSVNKQSSDNILQSIPPGEEAKDGTLTFDMSTHPYTVTIFEVNKCGASTPVTIEVPAAPERCRNQPRVVKNSSSDIDPNEIAILANPSTKTITIKSEILYNDIFTCRLFDLTGRLVDTRNFETIDISIDYSDKQLPSGLYIFNISTSEKSIKSAKFYLENY